MNPFSLPVSLFSSIFGTLGAYQVLQVSCVEVRVGKGPVPARPRDNSG